MLYAYNRMHSEYNHLDSVWIGVVCGVACLNGAKYAELLGWGCPALQLHRA